MADREKVINTLDEFNKKRICLPHLIPWDEIAGAIELLKEQDKQKFFVDENGKITPLPVVVRCTDCIYRGDKHKCIVAFVADKQEFPIAFYDNHGEWFCADGERRTD